MDLQKLGLRIIREVIFDRVGKIPLRMEVGDNFLRLVYVTKRCYNSRILFGSPFEVLEIDKPIALNDGYPPCEERLPFKNIFLNFEEKRGIICTNLFFDLDAYGSDWEIFGWYAKRFKEMGRERFFSFLAGDERARRSVLERLRRKGIEPYLRYVLEFWDRLYGYLGRRRFRYEVVVHVGDWTQICFRFGFGDDVVGVVGSVLDELIDLMDYLRNGWQRKDIESVKKYVYENNPRIAVKIYKQKDDGISLAEEKYF